MKGLEFGKSGADGIKHEGISENKGAFDYDSLTEYPPFDEFVAQKNPTKIEEPQVPIQSPEEIVQSTEKMIEELKANLHDIFGNKPDSVAQAPNFDSRPVAPRTPPAEAVTNVNGEPFYPASYNDEQLEAPQKPQSEKTEAEKEQIEKELAEAKTQLAKTLEWAKQQSNKPQFYHRETQETPDKMDEIEQIQQSMNRDILDIIKEVEYRRQIEMVGDFDWEKNKKDPQYRGEWEKAREIASKNPDNKIIDIESVSKWGDEYRMSVVSAGGGITSEKITKEQYDILKKQFPQKAKRPEKEEITPIVSRKNVEETVEEMDLAERNSLTETENSDTNKNRSSSTVEESPVEYHNRETSEVNYRTEIDNTSSKNEIVNQIISKMLDAGDFHDSNSDISQKMRDIEYAKKKLQDKTIDELQLLLKSYGESSLT